MRAPAPTLASALAVAATALAGCGGEEPKPAKPKPTGSLSLATGEGTVFVHGRTTISATLLNARGGDGGRELRLFADAHPFDGRFEPVGARRRTDSGGVADFRVRVGRDTRYRAEVTGYGLRSDLAEVEAAPVVDVDVEEGTPVNLEARVLRPAGMRPRPSRVFFYFRPQGERGYRRIAAAEWGADGKPSARTTVSPPASSGVVVGCYRKPLGVGYTGIFDPDCGRARLPNYYFPK